MVQAGRLLEAHESFRVELSDDFSRWTIGRKKLGAEKSLTKKYNKQVLRSTLKKKFCHSAARRGKIFQDATTRKLLTADENSSLKTAMKIPLKISQLFQCEKLLRLLERLEENGLTYEPDGINE